MNCNIGKEPRESHRSVYNLANGTIETSAIQRLNVADEVFDNYGQSNSIYVQFHGFLLEQNPQDCVDVVIDTRRLPSRDEIWTAFRKAGIHSRSPRICVNPNEELPEKLLWALVLSSAERAKASTMRSSSTRLYALKLLKSHIQHRLARYSRTSRQDRDLLKYGGLKQNQITAIRLTLQEKTMFHEILKTTDREMVILREQLDTAATDKLEL